jgi:anaphase-promoting complex subunit 3
MASVDSALSPSASPMLSPLTDESPGPSNTTIQQSKGAVNEWQSADSYIFQLLRQHASAWQKMAQYECQQAIKEVESFAPSMQRSPWALSLIGRAYYEMVEYAKVGQFSRLGHANRSQSL